MTVGIVNCKGNFEKPCEIRNSYGAVCPSSEAVYGVRWVAILGNAMRYRTYVGMSYRSWTTQRAYRPLPLSLKLSPNATILENGYAALEAVVFDGAARAPENKAATMNDRIVPQFQDYREWERKDHLKDTQRSLYIG